MGQPAENLALLDKILILRIIYSLSIFSLGCIKTPWSDAPKFGIIFSAFIVDETSGFCLSMCWAVSKLFASDWRQVGGSSAKLEVFPNF